MSSKPHTVFYRAGLSRAGLSRAGRGLARRGAMTIEFALIVSFGFLPLVFAIFDWSWYFWQASLVQTALWQAAYEGASVDLSLECPNSVAETRLDEMLNAYSINGASIGSELQTFDYGVGPPTSIDQLQLEVSVDFEPILGLVYVPANMGGVITVPLEQQTGIPGGC